VRVSSRAVDVAKENNHITKVKLDSGEWVDGDAFVECTGAFGGQANCRRYGGQCIMCPFYRCPTFGDRVSIAGKAGVPGMNYHMPDGTPGLAACGLIVYKETLSPELQAELAETSLVFVKYRGFTDWEVDRTYMAGSAAVVGVDPKTGKNLDKKAAWRTPADHGAFMFRDAGIYVVGYGPSPIPLEKLREVPGLENAEIAWPLGGKGQYRAGYDLAFCDNSLKVPELDNLFCAGEKTTISEIQSGICSGILAGNNAVRAAIGKEPIVLPRTIITGDYIAYTREAFQEEPLPRRGGPHAGPYLTRLMETGLFTLDEDKSRQRVKEAGLTGLYAQKLV